MGGADLGFCISGIQIESQECLNPWWRIQKADPEFISPASLAFCRDLDSCLSLCVLQEGSRMAGAIRRFPTREIGYTDHIARAPSVQEESLDG